MFRIGPLARVLPLVLPSLLLPASALGNEEAQNEFVLDDQPCLTLVAREEGEFLIARLVLRTEVPVSGFLATLRFDHDALTLVECAPGELMHVGGCVVHLVTVDCKRGCTVESRVPAGTEMIGCGDAVQLVFRVEQKGAWVRLACVEFYGPSDERIKPFEDAPTTAGSGLASTSWASVKALYR
jgi:hypothetical protein